MMQIADYANIGLTRRALHFLAYNALPVFYLHRTKKCMKAQRIPRKPEAHTKEANSGMGVGVAAENVPFFLTTYPPLPQIRAQVKKWVMINKPLPV